MSPRIDEMVIDGQVYIRPTRREVRWACKYAPNGWLRRLDGEWWLLA